MSKRKRQEVGRREKVEVKGRQSKTTRLITLRMNHYDYSITVQEVPYAGSGQNDRNLVRSVGVSILSRFRPTVT